MKSQALKQQLIFDMDDTLIYCNKYFDMILQEFATLVQSWLGPERITTDEIRAKQVEIDVAGVHQIGFASTHFPQSLIDTYKYFAHLLDHPVSEREITQLNQLGLSVYDQSIEPYPGMVETLETLKEQGHQLYLYTGGETKIQQRKIEQMKLGAYFDDRIYIRQHKNVKALEEIIHQHRMERSRTWMIGNSLRTDIEPALLAGINSIYIKRPDEWAYNLVELKSRPEAVMYTISSLEDVPSIISENLTLRQERTL